MSHSSSGDIRQQKDQALGDGRMRENRVAQHRVGQSAQHCRLNGRHHFAGFRTKRGESQDAVAFRINQHLYKSTRFANRNGSKYTGHRHLGQAICDAPRLRFRFVQTLSRQFWIGEHAERYEPIAGRAAAAVQVVADDSKVVECDVRELRAPGAIAHGPNARCRRLQPLVHFDVAACVEFDSRPFEPDSLRVRRSPRRNQQVGAFDRLFSMTLNGDSHLLTGKSLHLAHSRVEQHFDSLVREVLQNGLRDIRIFRDGELPATLDRRHLGPESAQRLRQFKADVPTAEYDHMPRQTVEIERFYVRHGSCSRKPRNVRDSSARSKVKKHTVACDYPPPALIKLHFDRFGSDEPCFASNQFGSCRLEPIEMSLNLPLHHRRAVARLRERPRHVLPGFSASDNKDLVAFYLRHVHLHGPTAVTLLERPELIQKHYIRLPPAATITCPVIQRASSLARNVAARAMSSGVAIRPRGVVFSCCSRHSRSCGPEARRPSVSTTPGLSEFTRIFRGPSSCDRETVIAFTAALLAL